MHQGFTKRPEDEGRIVKGERNVSKIRKKRKPPFPPLFSRKRRIEWRDLPLSRRKTSPFSRDKEQEDDERPLKHERVEQSRKRGFGVDERSSNRANLSLSLSLFLSHPSCLGFQRERNEEVGEKRKRNRKGNNVVG